MAEEKVRPRGCGNGLMLLLLVAVAAALAAWALLRGPQEPGPEAGPAPDRLPSSQPPGRLP